MCRGPGDLERHAKAATIDGIGKSRAEIAGDKSLSEPVRSEILRDLDAEITRLKHEG